MNRSHATSLSPRARTFALLQAILLTASLVAAPILHPHTCTSPCSSPRNVVGSASGGTSALPPCHASKHGDPGRRTCGCTGDCCSFQAQFVTPPAVADVAAPTSLVQAALPSPPDDALRAPQARLLPFPTGPPPTA